MLKDDAQLQFNVINYQLFIIFHEKKSNYAILGNMNTINKNMAIEKRSQKKSTAGQQKVKSKTCAAILNQKELRDALKDVSPNHIKFRPDHHELGLGEIHQDQRSVLKKDKRSVKVNCIKLIEAVLKVKITRNQQETAEVGEYSPKTTTRKR